MAFRWLVLVFITLNVLQTTTPATAEKAQWLLKYNEMDKLFQLDDTALSKLLHLKPPIKVVSAIGEARIGKSTTLNVVRHTLETDGNSNRDIEEVFPTGSTTDPVTHGIWISVCQNSQGSTVLLDVEGTNMGNDAVTFHVSMFTALMSSGIGVFCGDTVKNHILDFLYRLPRLSEHVFKGIDEKKNFGHLHVVVRGALNPPSGTSFEDVIRDSIVKPSGQDEGSDHQRRAIAKHFPREHITVSRMPYIPNRELPKTTVQLRDNLEYRGAIETLSQRFKNFPAKTTLRGGLVDGNVLAEIAKTLVDMMNNNSWMDFGDSYLMVEKYLCDRSYSDYIVPVMQLKKSTKVDTEQEDAVEKFRKGCALTDQVTKANETITNFKTMLQAAEEQETRLVEAENKRKQLEQLRKEDEERFQEEMAALNTKMDIIRKSKEDDNKKIANLQAQIADLEIQARRGRKRGGRGLGEVIAGVVGGFLGGLFSDSRLKQNITTLNPSKYEVLGLYEVTWVWNKEAERLGLSGKSRGLIAQDVEQLYPWAVVTGHDGYKRVNYAALDRVLQCFDFAHNITDPETCMKNFEKIHKDVGSKQFMHFTCRLPDLRKFV